MLPVRIEGTTRRLGAPEGWDKEERHCGGLAIRDEVDGGLPMMVSSWEPAPDEVLALMGGARIMLRLVGTAHPPVALWVEYPNTEYEAA